MPHKTRSREQLQAKLNSLLQEIEELKTPRHDEALIEANDDMLALLVDQLAVAIEQARIFREAEIRFFRLFILREIDRAITTRHTIPDILNAVVERVTPDMGADAIAIVLLDAERLTTHRCRMRLPNSAIIEDEAVTVVASLRSQLVKRQAPVIISDLEQDDQVRIDGPKVESFKFDSYLGLPLIVHEETVGFLHVLSQKPKLFSAEEIDFFSTLAGQTAIAVENTRMISETRRRAQELTALNKATRVMASSLDLEIVLEQVLTEVRTMLQAEGASVLLRDDPAGDTLTFAAAASPGARQMIGMEVPLATSIAGWVVQNVQPILVDDTQRDPRFYDRIDASTGMTTHSLLAVPLIFKDKVIGVVEVINKFRKAFDQRDLEILESLSSSAAIAIKNARLYQAEREQYRRLRQSQAQLIHAEKMAALGRLMASIAHEINNPLQSVQGCLSLVEEELASQSRSQKVENYLGMATHEIDRIATIVRRMRDFYHSPPQDQQTYPAEADSIEKFYRSIHTDLQSVDLCAILKNVLQLTNKQLQNHLVTVECDWIDDLPLIQGNPDHLKQVFLNLVLNAVDAMAEEDGGTLYLRARPDTIELRDGRPHPAIRLEFADTGRGLPPEILEHLFEPFVTTKDHGSGLGLATSYQIIRAHQGEITAKSQEGKGTTFIILLPVAQAE